MAKAQVGDLVRIVNAKTSSGYYKVGEIYEVTGTWVNGVYIKIGGPHHDIYHTEYEIHRRVGEEDSDESIGESIKDNVNSPNHYTQGRVEVIDIIEDAVQGADPFEAVCQANILKYTLRYRAKNGVEDLNKAQWYLAKLISHEQRKIDGK